MFDILLDVRVCMAIHLYTVYHVILLLNIKLSFMLSFHSLPVCLPACVSVSLSLSVSPPLCRFPIPLSASPPLSAPLFKVKVLLSVGGRQALIPAQ